MNAPLIELIEKLQTRPHEVQRKIAVRALRTIADVLQENWALAEVEIEELLRGAAHQEKSPFRRHER